MENQLHYVAKRFDGSAFVGEKMDEVKQVMDAHGFKYSGKEIMYDGRTGKSFPVEVFHRSCILSKTSPHGC